MDRTQYIKLCQKYTVSQTILPELMVEYKGIKYLPKEYLMKFDKQGNPINIAILKDLEANSITQANLEKVRYEYEH